MKAKFVLTENKELIQKIKEGIKKKDGHCPCMVLKTEDTLCPCKNYRETGHCHCGLYVE